MHFKTSITASLFAFALMLFFATTTASAAVLNVVGGELVGASSVNVLGSFYDVAFVEGTCVDLFSGCDDASDFDFTTATSASAAGQALFTQVLVDGVAGSFDSDPELTFGCDSEIECRVLTPFRANLTTDALLYMFPRNHQDEVEDIVYFGTGTSTAGIDRFADTSTDGIFVFAKWTMVPEPSSALLVALGLGALGSGRSRRASAR